MLMVAVPGYAEDVQLAWDAPTTNSDGTVLTDLGGYFIYCSKTDGDYSTPFCKIDVGNVLTALIDVDMGEGESAYFVATAYDLTGNESAFSNEVAHAVPFLCPAAPGSLRVVSP